MIKVQKMFLARMLIKKSKQAQRSLSMQKYYMQWKAASFIQQLCQKIVKEAVQAKSAHKNLSFLWPDYGNKQNQANWESAWVVKCWVNVQY